LFPLARQALKAFVKDGRYDFIETGSLISIKKNIRRILIPSEEEKVTLNPMDFEEFLWAYKNTNVYENIRIYFNERKKLGEEVNLAILKDFRLYMLIGGMPGVVETFLETNSFEKVEKEKQAILELYRTVIETANPAIVEKVKLIFESIPTQLSRPNKKFKFTDVLSDTSKRYFDTSIKWLEKSKMINISNATSLSNIDLGFTIDQSKKKIYFLDTGLLVTLALQNNVVDSDVFKSLLLDSLHINEGMLLENVIAQQLVANGKSLLYYYAKSIKESKTYYEVDFIVRINKKLSLLEIKSSSYSNHPSLDAVKNKFSSLLGESFILYTKDLKKDEDTTYLPVYMVGML
jgi:hypothetical protein